jgi:hypothetical protein
MVSMLARFIAGLCVDTKGMFSACHVLTGFNFFSAGTAAREEDKYIVYVLGCKGQEARGQI